MALQCSDIFIVLPPLTLSGSVIFGKNSGRPQGEVQEIIYEPSKRYSEGERLEVCIYIMILLLLNIFLKKINTDIIQNVYKHFLIFYY